MGHGLGAPDSELLPDIGKGFARDMWCLIPQAGAVKTV